MQAVAHAIPGARVLLALKTALAVSLAWGVALHMPGVVDDYPYYAPLGALSAMYPTILGSVRTGLQTVAGLGLGILLAAGVLVSQVPNLIAIGLAVGIGVLLAGIRGIGAGAEYVPMAALFVLIIGGPDAEAYSLGYLVQMVVGVVIGLLVNVVVFPPLDFRTARLQLDRLQGVVADYLQDIADELANAGASDGRDWDRRSLNLARLTVEVREAVDESAASARVNPRVQRRGGRRRMDPGYGALGKLERVVFHLRDLSDVLGELYDSRAGHWTVPGPVTTHLAEAVQTGADAVRAWADGEDSTKAANSVRDVLVRLYGRLDDVFPQGEAGQRLVIAAAEGLERLMDVLDPAPTPADRPRAAGRD